uniref:Homoserine kinase-like n=1 Tax=Elaeis guineensis var. tenera TaxID=51953 RepID=A0A6J0PEC5_ELAGV|nr:homoserine kinase-like [Elaeis guineensis]
MTTKTPPLLSSGSSATKPPRLPSPGFGATNPPRLSSPASAFHSVTTFASATITNLGPGFDFLDCAIDGVGDIIVVTVDPTVSVGILSISSISSITASATKLSYDSLWNCTGMAAMRVLGVCSIGLSLHLEKGLPSAAASAPASPVQPSVRP